MIALYEKFLSWKLFQKMTGKKEVPLCCDTSVYSLGFSWFTAANARTFSSFQTPSGNFFSGRHIVDFKLPVTFLQRGCDGNSQQMCSA